MSLPDVETSWNRIRASLAQRAPDLLATIRPPATEPDIAAAEEAVGVALPADLLAWWRLADGRADGPGHLLPRWFDPYPVASALRSRKSWTDVWRNAEDNYFASEDGWMHRELLAWAGGQRPTVDDRIAALMAEPAGTPCEGMYLPVWLPIADSRMGTDLFVDLRDGPLRGCVMSFDNVGTAQADPTWPSVTAMLAEVANALAGSEIVVDGDPVRAEVDERGHLTWE
nr:SMI1/KNR4 family protein [Kibdelosporangium sp. MJ126-NF4]CEL12705.1 hypothetical protein [Kibdelosporangium sp. MJ126-NF4]CTQ93569.1 hypothetical protein [Kibdelosporangium sp. MJ126-NF4]